MVAFGLFIPRILCITFYLSFSKAVIFCNWEGWTFAKDFYFSFIILSTFGFGDFVPGDATLGANSKLSMTHVYIVVLSQILYRQYHTWELYVLDLKTKFFFVGKQNRYIFPWTRDSQWQNSADSLAKKHPKCL